MRIYFERTGGFAGMRLSMTIEDDQLDPEEIQMIQEMLEQVGFFDLPSRIEEPGVDRFTYCIEVHWNEREHSVEVGETSAPEQLCPLIEHLETMMRSQRGRR